MPRLRHAALRVVLCFGGGETAGVAEINDTMLDLCTHLIPTPKQGAGSCCHHWTAACLQGMSGMWQFQQLSEIPWKWLVQSRNLDILVSIALLFLGHM